MSHTSWIELSLSNDRPPCKGGHASCISNDGKSLVVFGGCDPFGVACNSVYLISLETGRSELLIAPPPPSPASAAAASSAVKSSSGNHQDDNNAAANNQTNDLFSSSPSSSPSSPPKRSGHCIATLPDNFFSAAAAADSNTSVIIYIIMFGGVDFLPIPKLFGDVWIGKITRSECRTTPSTVAWKQLEVAAPPPSTSCNIKIARHSFASALVVSPSHPLCLFVCGGSDGESPLAEPMVLELLGDGMKQQQHGGACCCGSWKRVAPSVDGDESSSSSSMADMTMMKPAEMCSACFSRELGAVIIGGGRDAQGNVVTDMFACTFFPSSSSSSSNPQQQKPPSLIKIGSSPSFQRTCASLTLVSASDNNNDDDDSSSSVVVAMIGGVPADDQMSVLPLDVAVDLASSSSCTSSSRVIVEEHHDDKKETRNDEKLASAPSNNHNKTNKILMKQVRPITRMEGAQHDLIGGVNFGIGQSLAFHQHNSSSSSSSSRRGGGVTINVCVSGIFPNSVGHTTQVFVSVSGAAAVVKAAA